MAECIALIVAAGKGKRFGGSVPKQFELLSGKPILWHAVQAFANHPQIDGVMVVIAPEHEDLYRNIAISQYTKVGHCFGGDERQDSVRLGLEAIAAQKPENVLIHDAARPFVSVQVISNVLAGLQSAKAVVPVVDCADSVRYDGRPLNRDQLKFVQTPQGFDFETILKAHSSNLKAHYTDDAQIAEAAGIEVAFVEGDVKNMKITTQADLPKTSENRVGMGFDVHAFCAGDHITICGVKIPHTHALEGHSDADVGLHAITDAILGAIGKGDIGEHFPPSDPQWKGADSAVFLKHAASLVSGKIINIDLTIICESPKITPHKQQMRENVARILQIASERVNVKATTTEKLGFTGRGEGIAAQAVAMIEILR